MARITPVLIILLFAAVASAQYNSALAWSALQFCKTAYCNQNAIASWSCAACAAHPSFTDVTVSYNYSIDTQGFTGYDANANTIVLAFRGTDNFENWIKDLDAFKINYVWCSGCEVHHGFHSVYLSLIGDMMASFSVLQQYYPSASVLVTGHSLGAAVSLLAALDIARSGVNNLMVYNFGEPRVGNPAFAAYAAATLPQGRQFRVTHSRDPVPHLPGMMMGFLHAPHELWYDNNGNSTWADCNDSASAEDPNCSDSVGLYVVTDHLLYLGICTECSCSNEEIARIEKLNPNLHRPFRLKNGV